MMRARVRQLRDGLIRPVARVRAGGAITVIHPGAPVARITPVDARPRWSG